MEIVLLTTAAQPTTEVLPALGLLGHQVTISEFDVSPLLTTTADAILVDARFNLAGARAFTKVLATADVTLPVLAVLKEGGLVAVSADWSVDDLLLDTAGPAEVDARLPPVDSPEVEVIDLADSTVLWRHTAELSERCQHLLRVLAFSDRPDYRHISDELGIPVGSIGPTRARCIDKLRVALSGSLA